MKAKFYVILVETQKDDDTKSSMHFGGFSEEKLVSLREMIETDIPNALKFTSKPEAESMCSIIREHFAQTCQLKARTYIEEIEAEYKIQSAVEFC